VEDAVAHDGRCLTLVHGDAVVVPELNVAVTIACSIS
jgi:hypothetical protein